MQVPDNVVSGAVTGTGAALQLPNVPCRLIYFQAKSNNASDIVIGGSTVASGANGLVLAAGDVLPAMLADNLNRFFVFGAVGTVLHYVVIR